MVQSVVELDCMMVVTRYTSIALYSRRVVVANFIAEWSCEMEDTLDPCSS